DSGEPPLENIPFTLDFNRNGRFDAATEPLARTNAAGIATFTNLAPGTYSVLEVFNDPNVPNPFPIPTGPNPVSFTVPGPNASVTPIVPNPTRTAADLDPLLDGGLVAQSSIPVNNSVVLDPGVGNPIDIKQLQESASAAVQSFVTAQNRDEDLLLSAPASSGLL
ncbi:MAG: SpaA isopeptide-forming pilin-related protein, partial [Microcoleus sp.]